MAKERSATHLSEDASEEAVKRHLPKEWVIRKLHPDYGVDLSIEIFERIATRIPTMGEFIFVQLKSTNELKEATIKIRKRGNVEKATDAQLGPYFYELDVVKFVIDSDTIDNARLMGASTPLILFVVDLINDEVYYVCLTDYYDKILEPQLFNLDQQDHVTVYIPKSNRLSSANSAAVMRFFGCRSKLYNMFNLAQFQFRESRYLLNNFINLDSYSHIEEGFQVVDSDSYSHIKEDFQIIERFARRLRALPIWDRPIIWNLIPEYKTRLDEIIAKAETGILRDIVQGVERFLASNNAGLEQMMMFAQFCSLSWEQFSAIGQTFEDIVREWFLPTFVGQLTSGEIGFLRELSENPA